MDNHHDEHTLYVETGIAHQLQIEDVFRRAITKLNIPCRFKVNLVTNRDGYCGYAYVWVSSSQVFHALIGKNLDGSERMIIWKDPNWIEPEISVDDACEEAIEKAEKEGMKLSWSDMTDIEDKVRQLYICPTTRQKQEPLVELPGYTYDEEQQEFLRIQAQESDAISNEIPSQGFFEIGSAYIPDMDESLSHNVLISRKVPEWITEEIIKNVFRHYASDCTTLHKRSVNGTPIRDTYPFIASYTNRNVRSIFVTFSPLTADARFALLMTRKVKIVDDNREHTLVFHHSHKN